MKKLLTSILFFSIFYTTNSNAQDVVVTTQNIFNLSTLSIGGSPSCDGAELSVPETDACISESGAIPSRCDFLFWNDVWSTSPRGFRIIDDARRLWSCDDDSDTVYTTAWYASFPVDTEAWPRPGEGEILAFNPHTNSRMVVPMDIRPQTAGQDASPGVNPCYTDPICNITVPVGTTTDVLISAPDRFGGLMFTGWRGIRYNSTSGSLAVSRFHDGNPIRLSSEDHIVAVAMYSPIPSIPSCPAGTETKWFTFGNIDIPFTRCRTSPPDFLGQFELRYPLPLIFDMCSLRPCCGPNALSCPDYQLRLEGFEGLTAHFVNSEGLKVGESLKKGNQFELSFAPIEGEPVYLFMESNDENADGKVRLYQSIETQEPAAKPWRFLFFGAIAIAALLLILLIRKRS